MNIDFSRFVALMAYQRSGTHMLGSAIQSHPRLRYANEIFYRSRPETVGQATAVILRYLDPDPDAVTVLDIKYNQIGAALPLLEEMRVIHLVRRDDEAHWFSSLWKRCLSAHPQARQMPPGLENRRAIPFDRAGFEKFRARKANYMARFAHLETIRLYYEDLCGNRQIDALPNWASNMICDLAGVERQSLIIQIPKNAPTDWRDYIKGNEK